MAVLFPAVPASCCIHCVVSCHLSSNIILQCYRFVLDFSWRTYLLLFLSISRHSTTSMLSSIYFCFVLRSYVCASASDPQYPTITIISIIDGYKYMYISLTYLTSFDTPEFNGTVHRATDDLLAVKLQTGNCILMALQCQKAHAIEKTPNLRNNRRTGDVQCDTSTR